MQGLPTNWAALCGVVLLLGLRHGLDADHLAAIDGLTRVSSRAGRSYSRYCGALFSLGHGAVVLVIAGGVGLLGKRWAPPEWFDALGSLISITVLALLGIVNLVAVMRTPLTQRVGLVGVRGRVVSLLLRPAYGVRGPASVLTVGAMFALSFDTLSQAALFAVMAMRFGGMTHCLMLGAVFVCGMLLSDGINGWWMSHLIGRTDRVAALASRIMTFAVASVALSISAFGAARLLSGHVAKWGEGRELSMGVSVILFIGFCYLLALRLCPAPRESR